MIAVRGGLGNFRARVFLSVGILAFPSLVAAAEWYLQPEISGQALYDDNRRLTPENPASEWSGIFSPSLTFGTRTPNLDVSGFARVDVYRSTDSDLNRTNEFFGLRPIYRTALSTWRFDTDFRRDDTLTTLLAEGDPNDPVLGRFRERIRRNRVILRPSWTRTLTPLYDLKLGYLFTGTFYEDPARGQLPTNLTDNISNGINAQLSRRLTEVDRLGVIALFDRFDERGGDGQSNNAGFQLSYARTFSETLSADVAPGVRYTSTRDQGRTFESVGLLFNASMLKRFRASTLRVTLFQGAAPSSIGGAALLRRQIDIRWQGDIASRWSFSIASRAFQAERLNGVGRADDRYYVQVDPTISYQVTRELFLDAGYRLRWQKRKSDAKSATSNAFIIGLNYSWDKLAISR
jgi:Uncharacterized protein conserved in bacteria (DUF2320).